MSRRRGQRSPSRRSARWERGRQAGEAMPRPRPLRVIRHRRGGGKTAEALELAAELGAVFVSRTPERAALARARAAVLGLEVEVISWVDAPANDTSGNGPFVVDDADEAVSHRDAQAIHHALEVLLQGEVLAYTVTRGRR